MNAKRILIATDFSGTSYAALDYASALAHDAGATLYIVHVGHFPVTHADLSGLGIGAYGFVPEADDLQAVRNRLSAVEPTVGGVPTEHRYLEGDAADEIIDFARRQNIDLIVIGTHGRTGLNHVMLGSVAEAVVRRASCPVLTVKKPILEMALDAATSKGVLVS